MDWTNETRRQRYQKQSAAMDIELQSFLPFYRAISNIFSPQRSRFFMNDNQRGDRRNQNIINSKPVMARKTARAGMQAGITNKARPWFKWGIADPKLSANNAVKRYLEEITQITQNNIARSNFYKNSTSLYDDLLCYGTSPMSVEENFDTVSHTQVYPVGSYKIAQDEFGRVNTFARDFSMTVRQLVHKYGKLNSGGRVDFTNISEYVKDMWENGNYEIRVGVSWIVQPNDMYDVDRAKVNSKFKKFASCYWETGSSTGREQYLNDGDRGAFLSEKGFKRFPILVPRWEVTGEGLYGDDCPAMTAIGDNNQLQHGEKRSAEAIEKKIRPPMVAPASLRNQVINQLPGGTTWVDTVTGGQKFERLFNLEFSIQEHEEKLRQVESRIDECFYVDLFRAMQRFQDSNTKATATEIEKTYEENLGQLGPVMQNVDGDWLDPYMNMQYDIAIEQRLFPDPPRELEGQEIRPEYMSTMHLAQKALGVGTIERFNSFVTQVAAYDQSVVKKVNSGKMVEIYADDLGLDPNIIRDDVDVQKMDDALAAQQQKADQAAQLQQGAETAKTLSETKLAPSNALNAMLSQANAGRIVPPPG